MNRILELRLVIPLREDYSDLSAHEVREMVRDLVQEHLAWLIEGGRPRVEVTQA